MKAERRAAWPKDRRQPASFRLDSVWNHKKLSGLKQQFTFMVLWVDWTRLGGSDLRCGVQESGGGLLVGQLTLLDNLWGLSGWSWVSVMRLEGEEVKGVGFYFA